MKHKYIKTVFRHFIIWTLAFIFWTMMREFGQEVIREYRDFTFRQHVFAHLILGAVAGLIFGSLDHYFQTKVFKHVSLWKALLAGTASYLVAFMIFVLFGIRLFTRLLQIDISKELIQEYFFSQEMLLLGFYCFLVGFFIDFFREVNKKLGPGNLWKMIKGEFYQPKEDERIFMFLDLKNSTGIAERIGHMKYSMLIQDCFQDLHVVEKYGAEVYQYVGDEAVLTWNKELGLINSNCLRAYFAFTEKLSKRRKHYESKYGFVPEFKAGLNVGKIVVAEVGELKTEIAYHGDTINTASRIQEQCNVYEKNLLISEKLQKHLTITKGLATSHVGDILLKGKTVPINLYSVESVSDKNQQSA